MEDLFRHYCIVLVIFRLREMDTLSAWSMYFLLNGQFVPFDVIVRKFRLHVRFRSVSIIPMTHSH